MERMLDGRVRSLRAYGWGLAELKLNRELLSIGRFAVEHATGVFEDGTPFAAPDSADDLVPLQLGENIRDTIIYLTLPITQPGSRESASAEVDTLTRYTSTDIEVADSNSTEQAPVSITVGKLRLRYALESSESAGLLRIGLARILEVRADNTVVLDDSYIPPALDARTSPVLTGLLTEIVGLLNHRGEAIVADDQPLATRIRASRLHLLRAPRNDLPERRRPCLGTRYLHDAKPPPATLSRL
jgi:type VI secretion system protein ImpJ